MANRSETALVSGPDLGKATGHVIIENKRFRMMRWNFAQRGDATGWHRHKRAYVIVRLVEGRLEIDYAGGSDISGLTKGGRYFWQSGVKFHVCDGKDFSYSFIEIELLQPTD